MVYSVSAVDKYYETAKNAAGDKSQSRHRLFSKLRTSCWEMPIELGEVVESVATDASSSGRFVN